MASENIGRIPPHNNEAETALLGAVLLREKVLDDVSSLLRKEDFYQRSHQCIWDGIVRLRSERPSVTIDLVTLTSYLKEIGTIEDCGGIPYIAHLTDVVPVSTNAVSYAQIIRNLSMKRQLLDLSVNIGDKAFDDTQDVRKSIDELEEKISKIGNDISTGSYMSSGKYLYSLIEDIHDMMSGKKNQGISSGFKSIDSYLGGFKPADLIIIGARPSVGKTAFALSMAHNMAFNITNPVKVGFFSLEMSGQLLMQRLVAREASINAMALRNGKLDKNTDDELMNCAAKLYDMESNLQIQDTSNIRMMEIRAQSRRMVREGVQIIFIDYIGLIESEGSSSAKARHEQVSEISRSLKSLARELNIPIICLAQLTRDAGKERQPVLADLRESGSIEQDADVVILLDDPSKRLDENSKVAASNVSEIPDPTDRDPDRYSRQIKVIIAKHRNGNTGFIDMIFRSNFVSFVDKERSVR
ncbi:MAG: replicative DNA helicase [Sphaerochaetaceae bacterium]|nr:replicative DNA helicase [Sphaerochaetaceae bacterium]